jgi:hypothetical protein
MFEQSSFTNFETIRKLHLNNAVIIDARDPQEIIQSKDAIAGHINLPFSAFNNYVNLLKSNEGL